MGIGGKGPGDIGCYILIKFLINNSPDIILPENITDDGSLLT